MRVQLKVLAGIGLPVFAHHSGPAVFNTAKKFELKGVVTKVEWTNPHAHFFMDVKDSHDICREDNYDLRHISGPALDPGGAR
jgi:hypothetical protein